MNWNHRIPSRANLLALACFLISSATGCSGCFGPDDQGTSKEGYFELRFAADEKPGRSWNPADRTYVPVALATGATLDVRVLDYEPHTEPQHVLVEPRDVRVEPPSVAEVVSTGIGRLTVRGLRAGEASVHFTAEADGEVVDDSFEIRVADASQLAIRHFLECSDFYVAGYPFFVDFALLPGDLAGAGIHPIAVEPEGATDVDEEQSNGYAIVFEAPEPETTALSLRSELDPADLEQLALRFLEPSEIEGFGTMRLTGALRQVGDSLTLAVLPQLEGRLACSIMPVQVRSTTPEICDLHGLADPTLWRAAESSPTATAVLVALAAGTCLLEIIADDIPGLATGAAARVVLGFEIEDPPEPSSGGGADYDD